MRYLFIILLYIYNVCSNGMITHIEVSLRNIVRLNDNESYFKLLSFHRNSLESGSYFPDFGYNCLSLSNESEEAHWPTFYLVTLNYIKQQYTQQLNNFLVNGYKATEDDKTNKFYNLLTFLFGMVSHGTADIAWHSLDQRNLGFIDTLSKSDWNNNYGKAHTIADIGAEFVLARMQNLDHLSLVWDVPYEDLINIYKSMNYNNLSLSQLKTCMNFGYSATQAIKLQGKRILGRLETNQSPFLVDQYETYFKGGLNSLIDNVTYCWKDLIEWIEQANDKEPTKKGFCNVQFPKYQSIDLTNPVPNQDDFINTLSSQSSISPQQILDEITNIKDRTPPTSISLNRTDIDLNCNQKLDTNSVYGKEPDAMFGYSIAVDEKAKLIAVSVPNKYHTYNKFGSVYIYDLDFNLLNEIQSPSLNFMSSGRFGNDIQFITTNSTNIKDLIITEPNYSADKFNLYQGRFHLFDGITYTLRRTFTVPKLLYNQSSYTNFAEKVYLQDINNDNKLDLIVSSPNYSNDQYELIGNVCVYLTKDKGIPEQPDYCIFPNNLNSFVSFGSHIEFINYNQNSYLLVGMSKYNNKGAIEVIKLNSQGFIDNRFIKISAKGAVQNIGQHFKLHQNSIFITATVKKKVDLDWLTSHIYQYELNSLLDDQSIIEIDDNTPAFLDTKDPGSLLGMKMISHNQHLIINHPLAQWESGQIYHYDQIKNQLKCLAKGEERDRYGYNIQFMTMNNSTHLILNSIHAKDNNNKRVGKLFIIKDIQNISCFLKTSYNSILLFFILFIIIIK
ncbi:hypothetical protein K502DRAFT_7639 [Neoconidiobolus thromboides FSU 785]|nr:hypothetical protein K502DRAFT_7639 [Neoconidiobolus thromboides FSU 785]